MDTFKTQIVSLEGSDIVAIHATPEYVKPAFVVIKAVIVLLALTAASLFYTAANAADWSTEDVVSESVYQAANLVDTLQTVYVARHPQRFQESTASWALGAHPDSESVYCFMAVNAAGHALVTELLVQLEAPVWVRRSWQAVTVEAKIQGIRSNYNLGVRMEF